MGCSASTAVQTRDGNLAAPLAVNDGIDQEQKTKVFFVISSTSQCSEAAAEFGAERFGFEVIKPTLSSPSSESNDESKVIPSSESVAATLIASIRALPKGSAVIIPGFPTSLADWTAWSKYAEDTHVTSLVVYLCDSTSASIPEELLIMLKQCGLLRTVPISSSLSTTSSNDPTSSPSASSSTSSPSNLPPIALLTLHKVAASLLDPSLSTSSALLSPVSPSPKPTPSPGVSSPSLSANVPLTSVLFVVAGPLAGKKKQAKKLADATGAAYISSFGLLCKELSKGGDRAKEIKDVLGQGGIVRGPLMCELLEQAIAETTNSQGVNRVVVEGFPRNLENKQAWEARMTGRIITEGVVYLDAPVETLRARANNADERKDDPSFSFRFQAFESQLLPLVSAFEAENLTVRVCAEAGDDVVHNYAKKALTNLGIPIASPHMETTFAMIKPDAVKNGFTNSILDRITQAGFEIVAQETVTFDETKARGFYSEHVSKPWFPKLLSFITSGPAIALGLRRIGAIATWRRLAGPTDSTKAMVLSPSSIRAIFGTDGTQNAVHGSDAIFSANRELQFMFPTLPSHFLNVPSRGYRILLAGGPASGKGTQSELLRSILGVVHISTGELLRDERKLGTELGNKAAEYFENGKLVPDDIMIPLVLERVARDDCQKRGWMLDGFPRTGPQAAALVSNGLSADVFVLIEVPDDVLVNRVAGRRTHSKTGKIYHLTFNPPPPDVPSTELEQRADDTEEKVKGRIQSYKANIDSIRETFSSILATVDGNRSANAVFESVLACLPSHL